MLRTTNCQKRPMAEPRLKTVTRTQGNNQALKDGTAKPKTFAFDFVEVPVLIDGFRRMVRGNEFDICEMAITTYICAKAHGKPMTAMPVFSGAGVPSWGDARQHQGRHPHPEGPRRP